MTVQLRLPGVDPPQQVRPAADRGEPVLWVRRIRVLRELQPGDEYVVRDVELRRGLNIVWAPPEASTNGNALFRSGVAGHTAGKTTFCRLVRHALGEGGFAAEATRRRIRETLPAGWLLAEVVVAGRLWTVARPFGLGHHPFCVEASDADQVLAGGERVEFQMFLDAVGTAVTGPLPACRFPTREESVRWPHILPWLTRDQECRFADFLEWRHSSSGSDA
ncbi:MAG: chromosome segregation protein SMC, partial [Deltaproteobacteria bacterium HGW-Deltaproteobacteria-20]